MEYQLEKFPGNRVGEKEPIEVVASNQEAQSNNENKEEENIFSKDMFDQADGNWGSE